MFKKLFDKIQRKIDETNFTIGKLDTKEDYEKLVRVDSKVSRCIGLGKEGSILEIILIIGEINEEFIKINKGLKIEEVKREVDLYGRYVYCLGEGIEIPNINKALKEPIYVTEEYKNLSSRLYKEGLKVSVNKNYIEKGLINKIIIEEY